MAKDLGGREEDRRRGAPQLIAAALKYDASKDEAPVLAAKGRGIVAEKILEIALEDGDVLDFQQVLKALGRDATEAEWDRIGQRALALGKYTFALQAFEKSRNEGEIERVKQLMSAEGIDRKS